MPSARLVRIHGEVQGVFFRDSTQREAERLGVSGWVRNLDDGSVEAFFEGSNPAVGAMIAWCETGPPAASVTSVEAVDAPPEGLTGFSVR